MTPAELSARIGVPVRPAKGDGTELISALLGIHDRKD